MGKIGEYVTFDPVSDKVNVAEKCHEAVTSGNHVDGAIDDGRHFSDGWVSHLDIDDKHLPEGGREVGTDFLWRPHQ